MRNVSVYDCAMNYGTSVHYIEKTMQNINFNNEAERTNKGQGYWKAIEKGERYIKRRIDLMEEGLLSKGRAKQQKKTRT